VAGPRLPRPPIKNVGRCAKPPDIRPSKNEKLVNQRTNMKTMLTRTVVALGVALGLGYTGLAFADEQVSTAKLKTYKGTLLSVGEKDHAVTVRGLVTTRAFNPAEDCKLTFETRDNPGWADLSPGQKVTVTYYSAHGVRVARQIAQHDRVRTGYITALDTAKRKLAIKQAGFTYNFAMADKATVTFNGGKSGSLENLKIGDTITVVYQSENDPLIAARVEQKNPTFTGTIRAIDAEKQTVTAKSLWHEKKFHVGDGCKIVINDQVNGSLRDLRIGDRMSVSYENADGVLVASRISREAMASDSEPTIASDQHP
jgi:Cu/Ag efflux protein CusF